MWDKIKVYAVANPKLAAFSIFLDLFIIGMLFKVGITTTFIVVGVVGMTGLAIMMLVNWMDD